MNGDLLWYITQQIFIGQLEYVESVQVVIVLCMLYRSNCASLLIDEDLFSYNR
jgi:hypothetical protein